MELTSVKIENYRGIESLTLPLDPKMTVLFGPNGCGKTSVLTAIAMPLGAGAEGDYDRVELDRRGEQASLPRVEVQVNGQTAAADGLGMLVARATGFVGGSRILSGSQHRGAWDLDMLVARYPKARLYDIDRAVTSSLIGRHVSSTPDYDQLFEWLYSMENRELRANRSGENAEVAGLSAVRAAICRMLDNVSDPRTDTSDPPHLVVDTPMAGTQGTLKFEQLSDGYRGVLALAADIARHLPQPESDDDPTDPLAGEMVVLIDEIELHLHPAWQQRILTDFMRTFPNVQFVVSTHSPQVLSTLRTENIVELAIEDGRIVAGPPRAPTYGAEAGSVLAAVMGVEERPDNVFSKMLREYMRLIDDDMGESEEALAIRRKLDELSLYDSGLDDADLDIRRRKMLREMGRS